MHGKEKPVPPWPEQGHHQTLWLVGWTLLGQPSCSWGRRMEQAFVSCWIVLVNSYDSSVCSYTENHDPALHVTDFGGTSHNEKMHQLVISFTWLAVLMSWHGQQLEEIRYNTKGPSWLNETMCLFSLIDLLNSLIDSGCSNT